MSLSTIRHNEVFNSSENNDQITLIGAGAIGSRIWSALVELGLTNLIAIDFDHVEPHNLANQIYGVKDVNKAKITALRDWTVHKIGYVPDGMGFIEDRVALNTDWWEPTSTVILAVDTVHAREEIVHEIVDNQPNVYHIFDVRMASTHGNVVYLNPKNPIDVKNYIDNLPNEEHAEVSSCGTSLSVGTTASLIANMCVWQLMHQRSEPAAHDKFIEFYAKPFCLSTGA